MRPEIARLLTPHIYQDLENHPSVLKYENVKVRILRYPIFDGISNQGGYFPQQEKSFHAKKEKSMTNQLLKQSKTKQKLGLGRKNSMVTENTDLSF